MLIIDAKAGGGLLAQGEGIFDFGKILLKKALSSNLIKKASKAINSELGQTAIRAVKRAADSDLGQEIKKRALSEVNRKVQEVSNKALSKVQLPEIVKEAGKSELGQQLQSKIISEIGRNTKKLANNFGVTAPLDAKAANVARATFERLGIAEPPGPTRKRKNTSRGKRTKKKKRQRFCLPTKVN